MNGDMVGWMDGDRYNNINYNNYIPSLGGQSRLLFSAGHLCRLQQQYAFFLKMSRGIARSFLLFMDDLTIVCGISKLFETFENIIFPVSEVKNYKTSYKFCTTSISHD